MNLDLIKAAARRLEGHIRRTPTVKVEMAREPLGSDDVWLKLECLQVTGSFKARGATNRLLTLDPDIVRNGIFAASGGNHGLAARRGPPRWRACRPPSTCRPMRRWPRSPS